MTSVYAQFVRQVPPLPGYQPQAPDFTARPVLHHLADVAARFPEKAAVVDEHGELSYAELHTQVERLAAAIAARVDPAQAQPIVSFQFHEIAGILSLLAIQRAGHYAVPIDAAMLSERTAEIIADSEPALIVTSAALRDEVANYNLIGAPLVTLEALAASPAATPPAHPGIDDLSVVLHTSGSTGRSKAVAHAHRAFSIAAYTWNHNLTMMADENIVLLLSLNFGGAYRPLSAALSLGNTISLYDVKRRGFAPLADFIDTHRIANFHAAATLYRSFLLSLPEGRVLTSMRSVRIGGEQVVADDFALFQRHFPRGAHFGIGGGASECLWLADAFLPHGAALPAETTMPWGFLLPTGEIEIWDEDGNRLPEGQRGEIVAHNQTTVAGYWRQPDREPRRFIPDAHRPGWRYFRTGDAGRLQDVDLLFHLGRFDFMVKVRGYRVELGEVEAALRALPGVAQAVVVARPHKTNTSQLDAYIVPEQGDDLGSGRVRSQLQSRLPNYMLPTTVTVLDALPLNSAGKVDRDALPEPDTRDPRAGLNVPYRKAVSVFEAHLVEIWEEILEVAPIGIDDPFTTLGGDSLTAARIFVEVERLVGWPIPAAVLVESETVAELARRIGEDPMLENPRILRLREGDPGAAPLFFIAPLGTDPLAYARIIRKLPEGPPVYALHSIDFEGREIVYRDLRAFCAAYIPEIKRVAPTGPYRFMGWSFGGILGFELSDQLQQLGDEVQPLIMMDSYGPGMVTPRVLMNRDTPAFVRRLIQAEGLARYVRKRVLRVPGFLTRILRYYEAIARVRLGLDRPGAMPIIANPLLKRYAPGVGAFDVYRIVSEQATMKLPIFGGGWQAVVGGRYVEHPIRGNHTDMLFEPGASEVARLIAETYGL